MPAFNAERFVREAADSILAQTFRDLELIAIDDGSMDSTGQVLDEFARDDHRVLVIHQQNQGYTRAMNAGLARATGKYIARMDADDVSLPRRLMAQVQYLDRHPDCVVVGCAPEMIDDDGDLLYKCDALLDHQSIESAHLGKLQTTLTGLVHPAVMIRHASLRLVGGYRPEFEPAEDRDLWLRLAEIGQLANLGDVLFRYRIHLASSSVQRSQEQLKNARRAILETFRRRGQAEPEDVELYEPRPSRESDLRAQFARRACEAGNYRTARKHAWWLIQNCPHAIRLWPVNLRAMLGIAGVPIWQAGSSVKSFLRSMNQRRPRHIPGS